MSQKSPSLKMIRLLLLIVFVNGFLYLPATAGRKQLIPNLEQRVTISFEKISLKEALDKIANKASVHIMYSVTKEITASSVSINVKDKPLKDVLNELLAPYGLTYQEIDDKIVINRTRSKIKSPLTENRRLLFISLKGTVKDEQGKPLPGASVKLKQSGIGVITDKDGNFEITNASISGTLVVSFIGYQTIELNYEGIPNGPFEVQLKLDDNSLNEVQVIAYGTTTKRITTGDVTHVNAADISKQPVTNPLGALEGKVPGMVITQSSGVSGAGYSVQIRGQNSLLQGSDPLFIIDGVPFAPGNSPLNQLSSAAGSGLTSNDGMSPFNLIAPSDIESIDVLKDADATAIYGSRGANGVILITTKKGKSGKTTITANVYTGISTATRTMDMLNTQQYVAMRKEAYKNDGIVPDASTAPDLFLWDTTRYTNFKKLFIGNTAHMSNAQLSLSGGDENTQFLIGGSYNHQTTVFPTDQGDNRGAVHLNLNHTSTDKKFIISLNTIYSSDVNNLPTTDLAEYINTPPNLKVYDSAGKLNWEEGGVTYASLNILNTNPLAFENQVYTGKFQNLSSNLQISYKILPALSLKVSLGYNTVTSNEVSLYSSTSLDPNQGQLPFSNFANQEQKSWIIEPQAEYRTVIGPGKLDVLIGNTWQDNTSDGLLVQAYNYSSDLLLSSVSAAGITYPSNTFSEYRYDGAYGRVNYNINDKYLFNLSGRRDGSSRFGPDNRFSNFGAIGAAWIFSEEGFVENALHFLSFGKIRASYGVTGNDQIGDYKYLDTWTPGYTTYQGSSVLNPSSLYNPNYSWEKNIKAELALDLGFLKDRILITTDYYRNRSNNQLVDYTLPSQTGFTSVLENLNASVQNTGLEFQVNSKNIETKDFTWSTNFNMTFPQNKLLAFPGLAGSSYANTFVIGHSLSTRKYYHYLGVNPANGIYQFAGEDQDGNLTESDKSVLKNTDPKFYGGLQNNFKYKKIEISVFLEFKKQNGLNYLNTLSGNVPGEPYVNQPVVVLSRWQNPGDKTNVEQFTSSFGPAYTAASNYLQNSDAIISDASYIRLKNLSLSYDLGGVWLTKAHFSSCRIYLQGQNIFTITNYVGADPENQNMYILPPLKTLTAGIQFTL